MDAQSEKQFLEVFSRIAEHLERKASAKVFDRPTVSITSSKLKELLDAAAARLGDRIGVAEREVAEASDTRPKRENPYGAPNLSPKETAALALAHLKERQTLMRFTSEHLAEGATFECTARDLYAFLESNDCRSCVGN